MKRVTRLTALLTAFALVCAFCLTAVAATGKVKLSSGTMNVRKSASTSAAKVTSVKNGTTLEILGEEGEWYKVKVNGKTGFVKKEYVVASSTAASSSAATSGSTATVSVSKATLYSSAKTSSTKIATVTKGTQLTVVSSTSSWYKVNYNGKTAYIPKKNVTVSTGSTASATPSVSAPVGGITYKNSSITKPAEPVTSAEQLYNAINWNFTQFNTSFTVQVKNFNQSMLPTRTRQLEYGFTTGNIEPSIGTASNGVTPVTFTVKYSPAGQVIGAYTMNKPTTDSRAAELKSKVDSIISQIITSGMTQAQKVVACHDYIVGNTDYSESVAEKNTAYTVLMNKQGNCQGYAEANAVLLSAAGIENRFIWADSKISSTGTHGFNKVNVDGKWYNVDCTVDDPMKNASYLVKHDFLMVSDDVSLQRYSFETARYPAASDGKNNWHYQNNFVATSQAELESIVKAQVAEKKTQVSVWVEDYSSSKYSTAFVKTLSGVKSVKATNTPAASSYKTYKTAIFMEIAY